MSTYEYPDFVDTNGIIVRGSKSNRYSLKIPFKNPISDRQLCVILKNPSQATVVTSDRTINNVLKYIYYKNYGYKSICILNLFPFQSTDPKFLTQFYQSSSFSSIMQNNHRVIRNECKGNDVIFAWGTNTISQSKNNQSIYDTAISSVIRYVTPRAQQTYFIESCKNKCRTRCTSVCLNRCLVRYPLHGLRWRLNNSRIQY